MSADALEEIAQACKRIDVEPLAVAMRLVRVAAVRPPSSFPQKTQFFLPTATPRSMGHEMLHKLSGLFDPEIQARLGLTVNPNDTSNIAAEFKRRCLD